MSAWPANDRVRSVAVAATPVAAERPRQRRQETRIDSALTVTVTTACGRQARGCSHGLSPFGLQIRTDVANRSRIVPSRDGVAGPDLPLVRVDFWVPLAYGLAGVTAQARVVHSASLDAATAVLGLEFVRMRRSSRRSLSWFLEQALSPLR